MKTTTKTAEQGGSVVDSTRVIGIALYYRRTGHHDNDTFPPIRVVDNSNNNDEEELVRTIASQIQQDQTLCQSIQEWYQSWKEPMIRENHQETAAMIVSEGENLRQNLEDYFNDRNKKHNHQEQQQQKHVVVAIVQLQERPIHKIRLMNEYSVDWPIWPDYSSTQADDDDDVDCRQFLTLELQDRITAWATHFGDNFTTTEWGHIDPDWQTPQQKEYHRREGHTLQLRLQEELNNNDPNADWEVNLDLWECQEETTTLPQ